MKFKLGFLIFCFVAICGCNSENRSETSDIVDETIDLTQFDYLANLFYDRGIENLNRILPSNKTLVAQTEEGLLYTFDSKGVKHTATFLFYGFEWFLDGTVSIEFSGNTEVIERVFIYITKLFEIHLGKADFDDITDTDQTITWIEEDMEENLYIRKLTKYDKLISVNFILEESNEDYGFDGSDGEWVQRGEDGEWVYVPF